MSTHQRSDTKHCNYCTCTVIITEFIRSHAIILTLWLLLSSSSSSCWSSSASLHVTLEDTSPLITVLALLGSPRDTFLVIYLSPFAHNNNARTNRWKNSILSLDTVDMLSWNDYSRMISISITPNAFYSHFDMHARATNHAHHKQ